MKSIAVILVTLMSVGASADLKEVVEYNCTAFASPSGDIMMGAQAPKIVRLKGDRSNGKSLYIRTAPLVPNAKPSYEKLRKVAQQIEGSQYKSKNYDVSLYYMAGMKGTIQSKDGGRVSQCESVSNF